MVRQFFLLIAVLVGQLGLAQKVEVLAEYQSMIQASDMVVSPSNCIYISGAWGEHSFVMKLDSGGNELWFKTYEDPYTATQINRMQIDDAGNLYLHQSRGDTYQDETYENKVIKVDSNGVEIWNSDTIPGEIHRFAAVQMLITNNELLVVHDSRSFENHAGATMITKLALNTGDILFQTDPLYGILPPTFNQVPSFKEGHWIIHASQDILEIAPDGSYRYIDVQPDLQGELICATEDGYLVHSLSQKLKLSDFEIWETELIWYDTNWQLSKNQVIKPLDSLSTDTISFIAQKIIPSSNKGLIATTHTNVKGDSLSYGSTSFAQINPDNGKTLWDTILTYGGGTHSMIEANGYALALEALGASQTGIRLYKISVPDIAYETEFITHTKEVEKHLHTSRLSIFPNPTSTTLNIKFEQAQEATVGVYSLTGALLLERQVNTQSAQLDVSGLPEGMYLVRVSAAQGIESQKVIIGK